MKLRISIICSLALSLVLTVGCAKEERSRMRNTNREALYQQKNLSPIAERSDGKGQQAIAPIAEAPRSTVWGRNMGAY